ncbi:uncharacterized protein C3orf22 homolog isoform X1 [Macaca thibetana thibetana]|uniref:uncharacterized protein C3orf22 homolog isoform X1 n=1 Tax=Macaca thibetana thibetana TaxID=257877 RepID=UPI0021BCED61|nr:uncharacterized protein C3orf22 homolog isoform X1 [Macaca thibetana thibetana]
MDSNARKKSHLGKKWRIQAQENFVKKFPYRFSGLTEPDPEPLHPWEVTNNLNTVELPLQKRLVPTRSIPVRGVGVRIKECECHFQDFIPNVHSHKPVGPTSLTHEEIPAQGGRAERAARGHMIDAQRTPAHIVLQGLLCQSRYRAKHHTGNLQQKHDHHPRHAHHPPHAHLSQSRAHALCRDYQFLFCRAAQLPACLFSRYSLDIL